VVTSGRVRPVRSVADMSLPVALVHKIVHPYRRRVFNAER
jgi:hypothetical protein